jgi:hypothetical protein
MMQEHPPSLEHKANSTAIPVQAVDADQLPREKGWTYEEMTSIVGSLYLDSAHRMKVQEEQFNAIAEEYEKRVMQMHAEIQLQQEEVDGLRKQVASLTRELEAQHGHTRTDTPSSGDGNNNLPSAR